MRPPILDLVESRGFQVFESGDYNLNIIGIRNPEAAPNRFDDMLIVVWKEKGIWKEERFPCTTAPGQYWLQNPGRRSGTAVLKHDQQMRSVYKLDNHGSKNPYLALCQRNGAVTVWRDPNKDLVADYGGDEDRGYFGINIHRASSRKESTHVWKWSAGCTVISDPEDFDRFIEICKLQVFHRGWHTFTYTLLMADI